MTEDEYKELYRYIEHHAEEKEQRPVGRPKGSKDKKKRKSWRTEFNDLRLFGNEPM